jgi:hypothetical protein
VALDGKMLIYICILGSLGIFYGHLGIVFEHLGIVYGHLGIVYGHLGIFYGHLGIVYGHLGYFITIWYFLCSFGTFLPVLVSCTKKNLATLHLNPFQFMSR